MRNTSHPLSAVGASTLQTQLTSNSSTVCLSESYAHSMCPFFTCNALSSPNLPHTHHSITVHSHVLTLHVQDQEALFQAAAYGDVATVRRLVQARINVNCTQEVCSVLYFTDLSCTCVRYEIQLGHNRNIPFMFLHSEPLPFSCYTCSVL